jgi:hypothetical protein
MVPSFFGEKQTLVALVVGYVEYGARCELLEECRIVSLPGFDFDI